MTKEEILRNDLDIVIAEIDEYKAKIEELKKDKDKIKDELYKLIESKSTLVEYGDIEELDPIKYILDITNDDDEIELRDIANILGMSLSTFRSKIDKTKVSKYDRYDRHGTKLVRTTVKYIKEFLGNNKSNEKMIECIKYILKFHYDASIPIAIDFPIKDLASPLGEYVKFKNLTLGELVTKGLGRGLFIKPQLTSIQRLLFAYNIGYRLQWYRSRYIGTTYTVDAEPVNLQFRIYHKEK